VRPAVSVGRTTALDGYNFGLLPNFGDNTLYDNGLASYLELPDSTGADSRFFENGVLPYTDSFDFNNNHLVGNNDGGIDAFNLDDFINQDDQPAPEIQSSDSLAEKTPNLQPQFGASSFGCDDGGNAVSV
jgi:transcriptional activator HAC1